MPVDRERNMKKLLLALAMMLTPVVIAEDGKIIGKALQSFDAGTGVIGVVTPDTKFIVLHTVQISPGVFWIVAMETF